MYRYRYDMQGVNTQSRLYRIGTITIDKGEGVLVASDRTLSFLKEGDSFNGGGQIFKLIPLHAVQITGTIDPVEGNDDEGDIVMYSFSEGIQTIFCEPTAIVGTSAALWNPAAIGTPHDTRRVNLQKAAEHYNEASIRSDLWALEYVSIPSAVPGNLFGIVDPLVGGTIAPGSGIDAYEFRGGRGDITQGSNATFLFVIKPLTNAGVPSVRAKYIWIHGDTNVKVAFRFIGWQAGQVTVFGKTNTNVATPWAIFYKCEISRQNYRSSAYNVQ